MAGRLIGPHHACVQTLEEMDELEKLIADAGPHVRVHELGVVGSGIKRRFPLLGLEFGSEDPTAPTLGLFGGVHGLERIGSQTVLSFLRSLIENAHWDRFTRDQLRRVRVVAMPIVNPAGMVAQRRSNLAGVDLMRNAPVDAEERTPFLLGGHRVSRHLPWYRGRKGAAMEAETEALMGFVRDQVFASCSVITLDVHSGFGTQDRLWYPYSKASSGFPREAEARRLKALLDRSYPYHVYRIEKQAEAYTLHGDLWDYLFDEHTAHHDGTPPPWVPWTLEMGSWLWVRKNPRQLLRRGGPFNPGLPHRLRRVLRRHLLLFHFLLRAVATPEAWSLLKGQ